jgi:hypothetical protein
MHPLAHPPGQALAFAGAVCTVWLIDAGPTVPLHAAGGPDKEGSAFRSAVVTRKGCGCGCGRGWRGGPDARSDMPRATSCSKGEARGDQCFLILVITHRPSYRPKADCGLVPTALPEAPLIRPKPRSTPRLGRSTDRHCSGPRRPWWRITWTIRREERGFLACSGVFSTGAVCLSLCVLLMIFGGL